VAEKIKDMQKLFKLILLVACVFMMNSAMAQGTLKLGHINMQQLYTLMPDMDSAQKKLEGIAKQYENTLEQLQVEFNKKYEDYNKLTQDAAIGDLILRTKEEELQTLQQRIQAFQQEAQNEITKKRTELFQPVQDKATKAINDVGIENGFTYIFDITAGVVFAADNTIDVLPLVKKKLGIQ
jgi:outer membrane protein